MLAWNVGIDSMCILCHHYPGSWDHLFSNCDFSQEVWSDLASAPLLSRYTIHWEDLIGFLIDSTQETKLLFLLRYILQITLYSLWREPDNIKHGISQTPTASKVKMIDMQVRNQCLTINVTRNRKYDGLLQSWLATRLKLCF